MILRLAIILFLLISSVIAADEPAPAPPLEDAAGDPPSDAPSDESTPEAPGQSRVMDFTDVWTGGSDECCPVCDSCFAVDDNCLACDADLGCDGCGTLWGKQCGDANFYIGLDFAVLKPRVDSLQVPGFQTSVKPRHDYEIAPRVFAGVAGCSGWGGQVSYWTLQTSGDNVTSIPQIASDLDMQAFDVDITKTSELGPWSVQVGAGGRWAEVETDFFGVNNVNQRLRAEFEGSGPTFVVNVRRPLGCGTWALVGEGRASFLFGDSDIDSTFATGLQFDDDVMQIWEGRAGVEWTGTTHGGNALFFVRALVEAQTWNLPRFGALGSPDINLFGPTVSMGFVF